MAGASLTTQNRVSRGGCGFRNLADRSEGFVRWALADMRRSLFAGLCFLLVAPLVLGVFLWRASQAETVYTSTIPMEVRDYGSGRRPLGEMMGGLVDNVAGLAIAEPAEFVRAHRWEEDGGAPGALRRQFSSVLVTTDRNLATRTHADFLAHFAGAAEALNPGTRFEMGDSSAPGWSLDVDDSEIVRLTRISLWSGLLLYLFGLSMVVWSMAKARIRVA